MQISNRKLTAAALALALLLPTVNSARADWDWMRDAIRQQQFEEAQKKAEEAKRERNRPSSPSTGSTCGFVCKTLVVVVGGIVACGTGVICDNGNARPVTR